MSKCKTTTTKPPLQAVYNKLFAAWGAQHWWPGESRLEIMIGAILTQNTAWSNVEKAIANLKREGALYINVLHEVAERKLANWIKPAGCFRVKAKRIKHFIHWLVDHHDGDIDRMFAGPTEEVRKALLAVHGIGPETADCMLLYAGGHPVFVVDAYTRRFLLRHGWIHERSDYDAIARLFTDTMREPARNRIATYNEYHALIVTLAKEHCRSTPDCRACPLKRWLPGPAGGRMPA